MKYLGTITDNKDLVTKEYVDNAIVAGGGLTKQEIVDFIHPIGSLFISTTSTNPSVYLGGTWERWGQGRVPISVSDTDSDFNAANKTGGEKTHTLLTDEMPSHLHAKGTLTTNDAGSHEHNISGTAASAGAHTHKGWNRNVYSGGNNYAALVTTGTSSSFATRNDVASSSGVHEHSVSGTAASAGNHSHTISGSTASTGGGNAHNNMPPYITCYMWRRTA